VIAEVGTNASHIAWILGVFIVIGCLIAAAVVVYRGRDWFAALVLCFIAVVAAVLLL
jgi:uncharacterized membrane protein YraQ (UPF0718 family)